jgi:soluble lytic murein transglycosylase-like protein
MPRRTYIAASALVGLVSLAGAARAAERVTLRNGFEMQCSHHAEIAGRVRIFAGAGEESYIEFAPEEIAGYQQIPDPPLESPALKPPALDSPARDGRTSTTLARANLADAKLAPQDLREMLNKAGREHNLDVDLLASLVKAESGGNARAVSRAGARGLMQLMPATAAELGVKNSFAPEENVRGGTAYLDALLTYYHDNLALALAAYNAGPAAVARYHGIPPYRETRAYVARVIHEFNRRVRARQEQASLTVASERPAEGSGTR